MKYLIIGLFCILLLSLVASGTFFLIAAITKSKPLKQGACILLCFAILPSLSLFLTHMHCTSEEIYPIFVTDNRLSYEVVSKEERLKVSVTEIIKEKAKEDIYVIDIDYPNCDLSRNISKSVYEQYIGDENNTITVKIDSLVMWVADSLDRKLTWSCKTYYFFSVERIYMPWEERLDNGFTDENVETLKNVLVEKGGSIESSDIPFEFTVFSRGNGYTNDGVPLNDGNIIKWSERDSL